MDVNIDSLIQDGKDIRKELTYVSPSAGEWRMYDEYAIKNPSKYYSWVATCFRFLVANYPNESIGKLFQDAAAAFGELQDIINKSSTKGKSFYVFE